MSAIEIYALVAIPPYVGLMAWWLRVQVADHRRQREWTQRRVLLADSTFAEALSALDREFPADADTR